MEPGPYDVITMQAKMVIRYAQKTTVYKQKKEEYKQFLQAEVVLWAKIEAAEERQDLVHKEQKYVRLMAYSPMELLTHLPERVYLSNINKHEMEDNLKAKRGKENYITKYFQKLEEIRKK